MTSNEATAQILRPPRTPSPALDLEFVSRAVACFKGPCSASSFSPELGERGAETSGGLVPFPEAESPLAPGCWPGASTLRCCFSPPSPGLGSQLGPQRHDNNAPARWGTRPPREDAWGWELQPAGFGICSTALGIDLEAQCTVELESSKASDAAGALPLASVH